MPSSKKYPLNSRSSQVKTFAFLFAAIVLATGGLIYWDNSLFQRFISEVNPFIAIVSSGLLGLPLLLYLWSKWRFFVYRKEALIKASRFSWVVIILATIAIMIDLVIGFPRDINILFPKSLLFYPVIAFFVEIVFHVLPLTLVLWILSHFLKKVNQEKILWISIILVALFEPSYQAFFMRSSPVWSVVAVWTNLFLFNMVQLLAFKKGDFISMYLYRLIYYLIWHIIWGALRLEWLF
jgi:hypothetical protein